MARHQPKKRGGGMSDEQIGKNTADWLTLKHKAEDNEARWQAICADLEEKLAIAVEALWFSLRCMAVWEKYQRHGSIAIAEAQKTMREALEKLKGENK